MRTALKRSGIAVGLLAAVAAALYYVSQLLATFAITIPPASRPNLTPATLGLPYETVTTASSDGYGLKGWWVPAPANPGPAKAPILVIHGLGAGKEFMLGYVLFLHEQGRGVLAIDLRGHGESDPSPTTLGAREPLDALAWIAFLHGRGLPPPVLWGTSLGAVTALRAAASEPQPAIAGVIADAPFDTLRHTLAVHARLFFNLPEFPLVPLTAWQVERRLHFRVADIDSGKALQAIRVPVLLMAAENDRRMAPQTIRRLFDTAHEPKRFYLIPGEDHESRHFAPGFRDAVAAFLDLCDEAAKSPTP